MTHPHSSPLRLPVLAACLLVCFVAAGLGALASVEASSFYAALSKPSWAPPASWFGPVWSVLYILMAIGAWLAWLSGPQPARARATGLFMAQLAANALWSWLFFAWHRGGWALADIAVLWVLIVATIVQLWRLRPLAGALLLPYLAWVSFAAALNASIWQRNPQLLG